MPLLSDYARKRKAEYFLTKIPKDARILEVAPGRGWVREFLRAGGWRYYESVDLKPPADFVGDICKWRDLGLKPESYDVIIAFEVVEHVDCFKECYDLLKPGGRLLLTSPVPHWDWLMKILECVGLNQKRTSPHDHLVYFDDVPYFQQKDIKAVAGISQWGIFTKSEIGSSASVGDESQGSSNAPIVGEAS
jgi:SAM-dependent methyltransferase